MIIEFNDMFINLNAVGYIKRLFAGTRHRIAVFTREGGLMTEFLYDSESERDLDYKILSETIRNSKLYT